MRSFPVRSFPLRSFPRRPFHFRGVHFRGGALPCLLPRTFSARGFLPPWNFCFRTRRPSGRQPQARWAIRSRAREVAGETGREAVTRSCQARSLRAESLQPESPQEREDARCGTAGLGNVLYNGLEDSLRGGLWRQRLISCPSPTPSLWSPETSAQSVFRQSVLKQNVSSRAFPGRMFLSRTFSCRVFSCRTFPGAREPGLRQGASCGA